MTLHLSNPRAKPRWLFLGTAVVIVSVIGAVVALATNVASFEIDAGSTNAGATEIAYYSGNDPTGDQDDWVDGDGVGGTDGIFQANGAGENPILDCYDSDISANPDADGAAGLICDGTSNSGFRTVAPEQSIVSPAGKTPDDNWPIKPGNNTPKNDITHGYVLLRLFDSPCDVNTDEDNLIAYVAGERLNNEGDSFWGFELDKEAPSGFDSLVANDGSSFTLDFNRTLNDVLVSVSLTKGGTAPAIEVFTVNGFEADGDAIFGPAPTTCSGTPISQGQTNGTSDALAPPWNVLVCDPSDTFGGNSCRLVNGGGTGTNAGDTNIPERDFIEAGIDLTQFGISAACFNNVIFTSRSSASITADLKDVGGGRVPLCGSETDTEVHDAAHNNITNGSVLVGEAVHDKAFVSATGFGGSTPEDPTGTVTFSLYDNDTCDGNLVGSAEEVTITDDGLADGEATVESTPTSVLGPGSYSYSAEYSGDDNYPGSTGPCEPFSVAKRATAIVTQIHDAAHSDITGDTVTQGLVIHDQALVTESGTSGGPTITGTVTFNLYATIDCTGDFTTEDVTLGSNGEAETTPFTPAAGPLSFSASYGGDDNYEASGAAACEPLTVIEPTTILDKQAAVGDISVEVNYSYREQNDGSVDLTMPAGGYVEDDQCAPVTIVGDTNGDNILDPLETWSGDTDEDGILSAGETWDFECTVTYTATGEFTNIALGHGIDPVDLDVTWCEDEENPPPGVRCDQDERDSTTVQIQVDVTSQGKDVLFP